MIAYKDDDEPQYDTQTIMFYVSLCVSVLALILSIIAVVIKI